MAEIGRALGPEGLNDLSSWVSELRAELEAQLEPRPN